MLAHAIIPALRSQGQTTELKTSLGTQDPMETAPRKKANTTPGPKILTGTHCIFNINLELLSKSSSKQAKKKCKILFHHPETRKQFHQKPNSQVEVVTVTVDHTVDGH